jgi:hypothetical protein
MLPSTFPSIRFLPGHYLGYPGDARPFLRIAQKRRRDPIDRVPRGGVAGPTNRTDPLVPKGLILATDTSAHRNARG